MTTYWRVTPTSPAERDLLGANDLHRAPEFIGRLKLGDGIVMADWNDVSRSGIANAIGIVLSINATSCSAKVEWKRCREKFHPSPQGGIPQWRKPQGWFSFHRPVAERYRLPQIFQKAFPDRDTLDYGTTVRADAERRGSSSIVTAGYIYIIKSDHGSKIGRSVDVKSRTQLLGLKFPFDSEVVHYVKVDDYVAVERYLHRKYASKHIRGEWFDLSDKDIAEIVALGDPLPLRNSGTLKGAIA